MREGVENRGYKIEVHTIEPYYNWRDHYESEDDPYSPFFEQEYDQFQYSQTIYNHYIHPQWDNFGSPTLFMKILFADYDDGIVITEMMGEWNDTFHNDIMLLKRNIAEHLMLNGINKFILIGENVLNFHSSDDCYYEEWFDEVEDADGWIALLNFRQHVIEELEIANIDSFFVMGGKMNEIGWRTLSPRHLWQVIEQHVQRRLSVGWDK